MSEKHLTISITPTVGPSKAPSNGRGPVKVEMPYQATRKHSNSRVVPRVASSLWEIYEQASSGMQMLLSETSVDIVK